jgi:hypothetical protein
MRLNERSHLYQIIIPVQHGAEKSHQHHVHYRRQIFGLAIKRGYRFVTGASVRITVFVVVTAPQAKALGLL